MNMTLRGVRFGAYRSIVVNAGSLVGTTAVTSLLGFLYWALAAREYPPSAVGVAAAVVSGTSLLGSAAALGLGTLVISELPRHQGREPALIATVMVPPVLVGSALALGFCLLAPYLSHELAPLHQLDFVILFIAGVVGTGVSQVLDQALLGLLRGELQFWRNVIFSMVKLILLVMAGVWVSTREGAAIYTTWVLGILISLAFLIAVMRPWAHQGGTLTIWWKLIPSLSRSGLLHHVLNLALQAPTVVLPIVVVGALSAAQGAYFYTALMVAGLMAAVPVALSMTLFASGVREQASLCQSLRLTVGFCMVIGMVGNAVVYVLGPYVLEVFGRSYSETATWCLRILMLGVFPVTVIDHYVAVARIRRNVVRATVVVVAGVVVSLGAALAGARLHGLVGLSVGWVVGQSLEALFMAPVLIRALSGPDLAPQDEHPVSSVSD